MLRSIQIGLVITTLLALLSVLVLQDVPTVVWRHVLFATGVMPLILIAILYFIPVLTRSSPASGAILLVPVAAFLMGVSAVVSFKYAPYAVPYIAGLVLILAALEFRWAWRRRARVLGSTHPGVDWYLAALVALLLALGLIVSSIAWPEGWFATRLMHLHLNIFGFLGLTTIGTLRVLLPTVLAEQDQTAHAFLRRQLPIALAGALAITIGSAYWLPLSILGAVLWIWTSLTMLISLWRYEHAWSKERGAGIALGIAAVGWLCVLCGGIAHSYGLISADTVMAWLLYLFLLPLITGASSYLLPIWRWPGRQSEAHAMMRERLMAYSRLRVAAFGSSAILFAADFRFAALPAVLALLSYLVQILIVFMRVDRPAV